MMSGLDLWRGRRNPQSNHRAGTEHLQSHPSKLLPSLSLRNINPEGCKILNIGAFCSTAGISKKAPFARGNVISNTPHLRGHTVVGSGLGEGALTSWLAQGHIWNPPLIGDIGGDSGDGGQGDGVGFQSASQPHGFSVQVFCFQNSGFVCTKETKETSLMVSTR